MVQLNKGALLGHITKRQEPGGIRTHDHARWDDGASDLTLRKIENEATKKNIWYKFTANKTFNEVLP